MTIQEIDVQNEILEVKVEKKAYEKPVITLFVVEMEDNISAGSIVIETDYNPIMESWDGTGTIEEEKMWY
ncbi:hypothetical protein ACFRAE_08350 [Sphingobacterium sp. HJSM2_6]|uniref:hypothetical protein n=1 Tax=Sphingobacterium sp. HJSM2_6 TaxID=3366264 RepID=UPI003BC67B54